MAQPLDSKSITQSEPANSSEARSRCIRWFFIVGACAPIVWIALSYATNSDSPLTHVSDAVAAFVWHVECVTFPTVIFFLDAERPGTIIAMLLIATPVNGACYAVAGLAVWYVREGLRRLWRHL
jgi:hypothetical protein